MTREEFERTADHFIHMRDQIHFRVFIHKLLQWSAMNDRRKLKFKDLVPLFGDVVGYGDTGDFADLAKRYETESDITDFMERAVWFWRNVPGWLDLLDAYVPYVRGDIHIPDGTIYYTCMGCGSIIVAREDAPQILEPILCPHCVPIRFPGYVPVWEHVPTSSPDWKGLREFVDWQVDYWSDGWYGKFLRWKVGVKCKVHHWIYKTFRRKDYRKSLERMGLA